MGRKNTTTHIMTEAQDMSASFESDSTNVTNLDVATIRLGWTSADAVGTIKVQAKQAANPNSPEQVSDWFDIESLSSIPINMTVPSPQTEHQIVFTQLPFTDIRLVYTPTSGTGTMDNIKITAKQVGG